MNMMVTLKEILKDTPYDSLPKDHQANIMTLLERINKVREAYGKPMTVTSGYRSMSDHLRIYKSKGITDQSKIPLKSRHLSGEAVDIADGNWDLKKWCLDNVKTLENIGLWMEDFSATTSWTHFQIVPPKSGKRFFLP